MTAHVFMSCACGKPACASLTEEKGNIEYCEYFCADCFAQLRRPKTLAGRLSLRKSNKF